MSKSKGKDKQIEPTDLGERIIALQRKSAPAIRPRSERPSAAAAAAPSTNNPSSSRPLPKPPSSSSRPPDTDQFARMHISRPEKSPRQKLYNPDEHIPQHSSSSSRFSPPKQHSHSREPTSPSRQLFDHRKDDPVRFAVMTRSGNSKGPKSEAYVSASDTASQASSVFTLSSTTDGSSASSALFDHSSQPSDQPSKFSAKLKSLYREITSLEAKVKAEDADDGMEEPGRIMLKGRENQQDLEREKWQARLNDHKELAELIWRFLKLSLQPSVPASLRSIPTKYNINARLWTFAFHKLLESLRHTSRTSPLALEHLQDFIIYAYTFYGGLLEVPFLETFRGAWLEALGDLARYKYAVTSMIIAFAADEANKLTTDAVTMASDDEAASVAESQTSDEPAPRIDDSAVLSVGAAAARLLEVEPEKERWRCIAKEWYSSGLTDTPGTGRLHHHLGLLSRDADGEELRSVYHFAKSMTTLHPFPTSRESVLHLWSVAAQTRRAQPDARVSELFVLLHGMLFTNIQLDDFQPTLARFIERLQMEGAEEREWMMMGVINIVSVLEYGKPSGVLRRTGGVGVRELASKEAGVKVMAKRRKEDRMDVDEGTTQPSPSPSESETDPIDDRLPLALTFGLQLTFEMLKFCLASPTRRPSPFSRDTVNPYLTIILTFLATVLKNAAARKVLERSIPWAELAYFFTKIPSKIMASQQLLGPGASIGQPDRWVMLTSGCAPPLPEDWCLRGMEWVGRKLFERGYWKSGEDKRMEMAALDSSDALTAELTDGRIEDDDDDERNGDAWKRWVRLVRCGVDIASVVDGFKWEQGTKEWRVEGPLAGKVQRWKDEDQQAKEEEECRRSRIRWTDDDMDVDEDTVDEDEDSDDENDSEQVRELKARRRYLRSLLQSTPAPVSHRRQPAARKVSRAPLDIVPGYTVLVVDTNIFLSMLSLMSSVIESMRWTVVIPLPVIMELEGISSNNTPLGQAAQSAMAYISDHIRSHSTSMKVQTSKGNFLSSLNVRTEQVDFTSGSVERSMDDLILKAAIWQDEHWTDRSAMLKAPTPARDVSKSTKVVLLTLDRNLRLKARSRQLAAATETDLAAIFTVNT